MAHHKDGPLPANHERLFYRLRMSKTYTSLRKPYGVPSPGCVLPRGVIYQRWRDLQAFLRVTLMLTKPERAVVSQMVTIWMIKGEVYPTAKQVAEATKVSVRTFWRTIKRLEAMKMIEVWDRYVQREQAQISDLFRLERLIFALARFLAECGERQLGPMIARFLALPGREFWSKIWSVDNFWEMVGNKRPLRVTP